MKNFNEVQESILADMEKTIAKGDELNKYKSLFDFISNVNKNIIDLDYTNEYNDSKISKTSCKDALGNKLSIGDIVIVAKSAKYDNHYILKSYFIVGLIIDIKSTSAGDILKLNINGKYDMNKELSDNDSNRVYCGSVIKLPKNTIKNLYK